VQFDVYENENVSTKKRFPYLLDVQADLLDSLGTHVVIPLAVEAESKEIVLSQLMPVLPIKGQNHVVVTPQLAGISVRDLSRKVENVSGFRTEIIAALDMLITGV
jgi:toxin CcdB